MPEQLPEELFVDLLKTNEVRIERILSKGHTSPSEGWYDQDENEWVIVLQGAGRITFEDGSEVSLTSGDYVNIPKHTKHRVSWTEPNQITLWLAVFYR